MSANDEPRLDANQVRESFLEWFAKKKSIEVAVREQTNPRPDPDTRYTILYEVSFETTSLDQARVELWVTIDGEVAIGIETRERIAKRLRVKCRSQGFAAGHEPYRVSRTGLVAMLDLIANGQLAILPTVIPLFGLVLTKAVVVDSDLRALASKGYAPVNWLGGLTKAEFEANGHLLRFRRWQ